MSKPGNAEKYSLSEALQRFSDDDEWDRFAALETKCIDRDIVHELLGHPSLSLFYDERNEDDRDRRDLTSKREEALKAIEKLFVKKLIAGTLISDGYIYPVTTHDAQKHHISPDMWRFLRPQFLNSGAAGGELRFEGISVWVPDVESSNEETDRKLSEHAAQERESLTEADRPTRRLSTSELEAEYFARVEDSRSATGRPPTVAEDNIWRRAKSLTRERISTSPWTRPTRRGDTARYRSSMSICRMVRCG